MTVNFEELVCVVRHNTGLVWLCDICKNNVDGGQEYAVFLRMPSILHDGYTEMNAGSYNGFGMQDVRMTFVRFFAMLIRSRPDRAENSTAYTTPS